MSTSSSAELPAGWAAPFYAGKRVLVVGARPRASAPGWRAVSPVPAPR
jgi:hypothetical protein